MNELLGAANRWRTLRLAVSSFKALAQIPTGVLNELEVVELGGKGSGLDSQTTVFLSAPRLHSVTLVNVELLHFSPMPWHQLTHLTLWTRAASTQTCLGTIILCTNLVVAMLNTESWPDTIPPVANTAPTTLSRLQNLGIYFKILSPGEHLMPFLHCLHAPALQTFRMSLYDDSSFFRWSGPAFHLFQMRSAHIQSLTLENCNITSRELRAVLLQAVNLTDLRLVLCQYCVNDDLLSALRYRPSDTVHLAPKLEKLVLDCVICDFDEASLEAMIDSRWWTDEALLSMPTPAIARLKSVNCLDDSWYKTFSQRLINKMERYRSEGLDLSFPREDG
ncbi:hypothetical protein B0H19DRAFT_1174855 [Mycena capillaripes]|nr:hypothetical protein B0H19DRAFT_1174855 [Mycena capillaripes]